VFDTNSLSLSVIEAVFNKGIGLIGMGAVAFLFVSVGTAMQLKREKYPGSVGQLKRVAVLIKSAMVGVAFGSEIFLIAALLEEQPKLGTVMLCFRLLHTMYSAMLGAALFGGDSAADTVTGFIRDAPKVSGYIDGTFARQNLPLISAVVLLSFADVEMWPLLPWKASHFLDESQGFPSLSIMNTALTVNIVQSIATLSCQTAFLTGSSQDHISWQGKMIFLANILFSVIGVFMGFMALFMKKRLLQDVEVARELEETQSSPRQQSAFADPDSMVLHDNPMHISSRGAQEFSHKHNSRTGHDTHEDILMSHVNALYDAAGTMGSHLVAIKMSIGKDVGREEEEEGLVQRDVLLKRKGATATEGCDADQGSILSRTTPDDGGDDSGDDVVGTPMADRRGSYGQELRDQRSATNPIPDTLKRLSMRTTGQAPPPSGGSGVPDTMRRTSVEFTQGRNPLAHRAGRRTSSSRGAGAAAGAAPPPPPPSSSTIDEMI
jgi:hypothetical protein